MVYVFGFFFGIISGVFFVINILVDVFGLGVVGIYGDLFYYFLILVFLIVVIILFYIFWGVVFFDVCERRWYWVLGLVVGSYLLILGLIFLNFWYEVSLLFIYVVIVFMGFWVFIIVGGFF